MSRKDNFINEVQEMMNELNYEWKTEEAKSYWNILCSQEEKEKPMFTDNGKIILKHIQDSIDKTTFKAKDMAEELLVSSRTVSGAMRKLVSDGFVEKVGADPVIYTLTEKGKNINIEE